MHTESKRVVAAILTISGVKRPKSQARQGLLRRFIRFYPSFDIEGDNDDRPSSEISPKTILPTTPDLNRLLHFLLVCPKDASYTVAIFPVYHSVVVVTLDVE
jgi:hypothetical protein